MPCSPKLKWKLLTKKRGSATQGLPSGKEHLAWVTNTVTLLSGERDAVLVDTFLLREHAGELVGWIAGSGKILTGIYITHAHADHFFGLKVLLDTFPTARAFATPSVVERIQRQITPDFVNSFWEPRFPGQIPTEFVAPEVLEGDRFYLDGEELKIIDVGHTDTPQSTVLHVPSLSLVIAGDAVYNNTHPYLAECDADARREWLRALDKIEALRPNAVITGHGVLDPDSSPHHIDETRRYLHDFDATAGDTSTSLDFYSRMLSLHPNRVNPGSLWAAAKALKGTVPPQV